MRSFGSGARNCCPSSPVSFSARRIDVKPRLAQRERRPGKVATRHFAYFNARVLAMRGKLLPKETYTKFLQMEIPEIARSLGESEYKTEIEQLGKRYRGVDLVEYSLNRNLAKTFHGLIKKAQGELQELLVDYMRFYDMENVTTILRGKLSGISEEELRESFIPAGALSEAELVQLIEADYDKTLDMLRKLGFAKAVEWLTDRPLPEVEDMLIRDYYSALLEYTAGGSKNMRWFNEFLRMDIDFMNLINFLRLKRDNESPGKVMEYMMDGGALLPLPKLKQLAEMDMDEVLSTVERLHYFRESPGALTGAKDSLTQLEAELLKFELDHSVRVARQNPLSILVVLSYILAKRAEVGNIRIIARGKEGDLPIELIRRQLVV
jgi:V/A-type H+-transporting ATPase subunit C